jgi:catechol-2,3-dioxygenase
MIYHEIVWGGLFMRILEVVLQSCDISRQHRFYHDLFHLPLIEDKPQRVTFRAGHTDITFEQADSALPDTIYHYAFNIPQNQLEPARDWLAARVAGTVSEVYDFTDWNAHAFYFRDGNGNIAEFIARHNLDNAAEEPFAAQSIVGISEIGLATPDVIQTVTNLERDLGIPVWRGAGSDAFSAVGDEHGLFIVVNTGRKWLDTDTAAAPLPTRVTIESASDAIYSVPGVPVRIRRSTRMTEPR